MAHPSDKYIRYLLAGKWPLEEDEEWVQAFEDIDVDLKNLGIPPLLDHHIKTMMRTFHPPKTFKFRNSKHEESVEFMKKEGIYSIWVPGEDEKKMVNLLRHAPAQRTIRMLLMGGLELDQIVDKVSVQFRTGRDVSVRVLQMYMYYVWDYERVTDEEWSQLLWTHPYKDNYIGALMGSKEHAMWKCGFDPKVDGRDSMKLAHRTLHFRLEGSRWKPDTKMTAEITTKYTKELTTVYQILFGEGASSEDMIKRFRTILLSPIEQNVKSLASLSKNGSHSESGE